MPVETEFHFVHNCFLIFVRLLYFSHDITEIRPSLAALAAFQPALAQPLPPLPPPPPPLLLPPPPPPPLLLLLPPPPPPLLAPAPLLLPSLLVTHRVGQSSTIHRRLSSSVDHPLSTVIGQSSSSVVCPSFVVRRSSAVVVRHSHIVIVRSLLSIVVRRSSIVSHRQLLVVVVEFAPSTPPNLQAVNLEEGGGMWSALDYAPVLPMDHDPLGIAGVAGNTDEEPVDARESTCESRRT